MEEIEKKSVKNNQRRLPGLRIVTKEKSKKIKSLPHIQMDTVPV